MSISATSGRMRAIMSKPLGPSAAVCTVCPSLLEDLLQADARVLGVLDDDYVARVT